MEDFSQQPHAVLDGIGHWCHEARIQHGLRNKPQFSSINETTMWSWFSKFQGIGRLDTFRMIGPRLLAIDGCEPEKKH